MISKFKFAKIKHHSFLFIGFLFCFAAVFTGCTDMDHDNDPSTDVPIISAPSNGVLSYYAKGSTDTTMKYSSGAVTCHNETGYATLKIYPATALPAINTHLTRDLAADESFFTASMYSPYKAVGSNNKCVYWPEGSFSTVTVNGIFNTKTSVFTPVYTDSEACPDATTFTKDGENVIIDFHCTRYDVMIENFHFVLPPGSAPGK